MKVAVVVMSRVPEDLQDDRLVEYLFGSDIFGPNEPIRYSAVCQRRVYDHERHGRWHVLGYDAELDGEFTDLKDDGMDVYLVILESGRTPQAPDDIAKEFGINFGCNQWKCTGEKFTPLNNFRIVTYGFLEVARMDVLRESLLPKLARTLQ